MAALFSGGKDSTYAIFLARKAGHEVVCLISMRPVADDSLLFHYPNSAMTGYLADAMQLPLVSMPASGRSREEEVEALDQAVSKSKAMYGIEGIVHGGITSDFQRKAFEGVLERHSLKSFAPLWGIDAEKYVRELLDNDFCVMIVGVSAMGLGKEWLGKVLDRELLSELAALSRKHSFSLVFEGGEGETLVVDCPLYSKHLKITNARTYWDGQRGMFEILEARLVNKNV